ncbi:MAG: hypothetical protein AB8B47_11275 [Roseobacter sp.]
MKNALWIMSAVIIGGGGYLFFAPDRTPEPVALAEAPQVEQVVETPQVVEEVAPVQTVTEQLEEVITAATAEDSSIEEQAADVVAMLQDKAEEAAAGASSLGEQAQALVSDGVDAAREGAAKIPEYLTFEGFDLEKVKEFVDGSELSSTQKAFLTTAVTKAQESPEVLKAALSQVQQALGYGS